MKTTPVQPAEIRFDHPDHPGLPYASAYGDVYHARLGAQGQARHVFLGGNGLPARWQGRARFVILETGFGLGNNFLATWAAWRADPLRPEQLVFISVDKHPPQAADLQRAHADSPDPALAQALCDAWPPATPDLHTLDLDDGRVRLMLAWGEAATWLPELVASVDAFYLDGFAPARNEAMWDARLFKACARLAAADATAATWTVAQPVREALQQAGFAWTRAPGFGTKRDMLTARRHQPIAPPVPPGRRGTPEARRALVLGAGLAGAAAAWALARQGLQVTVLDRHDEPAQETSGNTAGLFHGVLHPQDGAHAQLLRAAALRAEQVYRPLIEQGQVPGRIDGLLRGAAGEDPAAMQALLDAQGLPGRYVQACSAEAAQALAGPGGIVWHDPAWFFPGGGWLQPGALVRHWLQTPGVRWRGGQAVARLHAVGLDVVGLDEARADAPTWQALDADGQLIAEAELVVVAAAHESATLLAPWTDSPRWPLGRQRGQVTQLDPTAMAMLGWSAPARALASGRYLLGLPPALGGGLLCGATQQSGDEDPQLRAEDHLSNLQRVAGWQRQGAGDRPDLNMLAGLDDLSHLSGLSDVSGVSDLSGRVGWRLSAADRLPMVGAVPQTLARCQAAGARRLEQPRQIPRVPGLYLLSALGSRGITLAPLLGEVLAAWATGAPLPLAGSLLDAIDVARHLARAQSRAQLPSGDSAAGVPGDSARGAGLGAD